MSTDATNPSVPLWISEGQKKADALASKGLCAIALLGVWNFVGRNEFGGNTFLADWQYVALKNREIRLVFDSDIVSKRSVQQALDRLKEHLQRKGADVNVVYLLPSKDGKKVGVDDWLMEGHTKEELESLLDSPRPIPQPAPSVVELLDTFPLTMSRPLALLNGRAYVGTWLFTKETRKELDLPQKSGHD